MPSAVRPTDEKSLLQLVRWAAAEAKPVEIMGAGTKRQFGRPVDATLAVDLTGFAGIVDYQPEELVLIVRAGTALVDIDAALRQRGQALPFEPPDLGPLFGFAPSLGTIGGIVGCNLSGPRRIKAGATRDHVLGLKGVSGRGEAFKAGGAVVKNVTGYDLAKLMTGSFGTLAALTEVTLKVLPSPEKTRTLLVHGLGDDAAIRLLCDAAGSPHEVAGLVHLPAPIAARSSVGYVARAGASVTAIRIEGPEPSVAVRLEALKGLAGGRGPLEELHGGNSKAFWGEVRDIAYFAADAEKPVWRLSVAPSDGPPTVARIRKILPNALAYYDWSGGLVWVMSPEAPDAQAGVVRGALPTSGGHATLIRAPEATRRSVAVFEPEAPALDALTRRIKAAYDPRNILNPGRMVESA